MLKNNPYSKSPLNYIGGKYKILPQIMTLFPQKINTMVDLFAGGCDVCTNINANKIYANDINNYVIEIYREFQKMTSDQIIYYIENTIREKKLSITNKEAYLAFRKDYNESIKKNPLDLYLLICYAFNHQFRFNNNHKFNSPFGKNRSSFNPIMKANLIKFHSNIKDIEFSSVNFKDFNISQLGKGDFLYADPPYLITTGSYNDGKRGFNGWSRDDDKELFDLLDRLNEQGVKFALSNVTEHKGLINQELIDWKKKYNTHEIKYSYSNSSYHAKNTDKRTQEILVTNY